jgi:hypothetical protein
MSLLVFWAVIPCGLELDANVFEEHTASIFCPEVPRFSEIFSPDEDEESMFL